MSSAGTVPGLPKNLRQYVKIRCSVREQLGRLVRDKRPSHRSLAATNPHLAGIPSRQRLQRCLLSAATKYPTVLAVTGSHSA
jgi:hypothetical protein